MNLLFRVLLAFGGCLAVGGAGAQKAGLPCKVPQNHLLFHDKVDNEQRQALRADGKADNEFSGTSNADVNYQVTLALTSRVDNLQCGIEADTATFDQKKVAYIRGIERILRNFTNEWKSRRLSAAHLPAILDAYEAAMRLDGAGASIVPVAQRVSYEAGNYLIICGAFDNNSGRAEARNIVLSKFLAAHPDRILPTLKDNADLPGRDSLIIIAAYRNPAQLYDYAAANNNLGYLIRKIDDSLVRTVSQMATSGGAGQKQLPFLDAILSGKITLDEVNAVKDDPVKYYKLLVKTRIDYVVRQVEKKDTVKGMKAVTDMLQRKAMDPFINTINGLHEEPDAKRFKILQDLSATELYYLIVIGGEELYTSSYVRGVYPLMMQKAGGRGDSLMMLVNFDRFKKFIKLAAGYNTLSQFLGAFPKKDDAEKLMTAFVNGLEKTTTLEDGVDVADSYASIMATNGPLAAKILENVQAGYQRNRAQNNSRGALLYHLLDRLFQSATDSSVNLSKEFGIPPVYSVSYPSLVADTNRVFVQSFFYGDKDGQYNYNVQLAQLAKTGWKKIEDTQQWMAWASTSGKPVTHYFNKPLDEESGDLEHAQQALDDYLNEKGVQPTVVIHRGHSYYAGSTIEQIQPGARIVFLGSCGGYHLIHDVLQHAPDGHIVSSKQTGFNVINQSFINLLFTRLRGGGNVDWIPFWKEFQKQAGKLPGFEDYIPPHRNLGAIFIKAYNSQAGEAE